MISRNSNCRTTQDGLAELLLSGKQGDGKARQHLEECESCEEELNALRATMGLLDEWHAPEPSFYFDARLTARLREERMAAPAGLIERLRSRFLFGSVRQMRPMAAGALALLLAIGGGAYMGLTDFHQAAQPASATVRDLQSLDENAQVFQQLNDLDSTDNSTSGSSASGNL